MRKVKLNAYAKINLSLDVLGKRENGYHELSMIMQQIDLKDIITIEEVNGIQNSIEINSNSSKVPLDNSNIVYRAWEEISKKYSGNKGVRVSIEKNIPISAGLAGGSTDAAAVLKGLNKLWSLNLTDAELMDIGLKVGADVPFCIIGGTALAEGIGEKLTKIKSFSNKYILLANPGIEVSTSHVYKNLNLKTIEKRPDINNIIRYIEQSDIYSLSKEMSNVLESVTIKENPIIDEIKQSMISNGAVGSLMSGSGATVFGIFDSEEKLENCKKILEKKIDTVICTKTI
ncbi:4-diphosphocytidyl-2-C-methyl-D-erythritol kinase IspE [Gottschalkia acidurici 9a]|uniref:4-diphosphocytidyl-2-C-methyl-D-erythritol kinase n=1 Tax=Gottschalkia acidurici (strain ATCC 7906 / DSM 604 / BCRC 14475 / CIP 104303 / KCTC 5404 / NCIMB 10678 / 9a) TaxID=1128398 RepID=K0AVC7_GOTA9|nr:4-(cytidine 5'-diphospho)-2-C-methyl-D-erythritol kinase [Gottschalkia acidurici]AFS77229.1 4-diphosphocytidyl-2-C-methyl-D-erythritol kinase IspE [Gottschalkia acidurici 9a]